MGIKDTFWRLYLKARLDQFNLNIHDEASNLWISQICRPCLWTGPFGPAEQKYCLIWQWNTLKVSKSWKQIVASWIPPKKNKKSLSCTFSTQDSELLLFIGRIEDTIFFFRDLLTFKCFFGLFQSLNKTKISCYKAANLKHSKIRKFHHGFFFKFFQSCLSVCDAWKKVRGASMGKQSRGAVLDFSR